MMLKKAANGDSIKVVDDQRLTPTSTRELARKVADLLSAGSPDCFTSRPTEIVPGLSLRVRFLRLPALRLTCHLRPLRRLSRQPGGQRIPYSKRPLKVTRPGRPERLASCVAGVFAEPTSKRVAETLCQPR